MFLSLRNSVIFNFLNLKPIGIADLTPPEADQMPSRTVNYSATTSSL